jgi:hypothetical protein
MKFFLFTSAAVTTIMNNTPKNHTVLAEQVCKDMHRIEEIRAMDMKRIEEIRVMDMKRIEEIRGMDMKRIEEIRGMDMKRIEEIRVIDMQLKAKDIQLAAAQLKVEQAEKLLLLARHADFKEFMKLKSVANREKSETTS